MFPSFHRGPGMQWTVFLISSRKCCSGCRFIHSQLSVCKLQRSAGICQSAIIRNRGNPVFFLSLITTDKKVNSNSKSASGTEYFHGLYLYSFYLCIKKTKGEKQCISIIFNCVPFPWVQYQTVQLMQP